MTLAILIVIIAAAVIGMALQRQRLAASALIFLAVLVMAIGCGPIPAWLLNDLQSNYAIKPTIQWGKRNAIILLGAGAEKITPTHSVEPAEYAYARIAEAFAQYRACRNTQADCKIITSGGDPGRSGMSEAAVYRATLIRLGVDPLDIMVEPQSMNTWQNARFTSTILARYQPDRLLLVTSALHLRRSELYFAHFHIHAIPVRADYQLAHVKWLPISINFALTDFALHEYLGMVQYYVYNALGWNV